jgi:hypothetical protein
MLIVLMSILLFGGSGEPLFDKNTRSAIKETLSEDRRGEVLAAIKRIESSGKSSAKATKGARKELARLEADRSAGVEEIKDAIDEIVARRGELHQAFIEGLFDMRESMNEEEWQTVFSPES